ncbi:MFS transporter [Candidatus Woesearchaeota archaeon]|nr:MAG: MFS transporter [Candidatus Woesearchaeota archaeon]
MFTGQHHHHLDKLFHLKHKIGYIYEHLVVQAFAISLVSIFVPIYLLTINFSLTEVMLYLLFQWGVFGLFTPLYAIILHKLGLKEVIFIRTPVLAVGLFMLSLLKTNAFLQKYYLIISLIIGFSDSLYCLSISSLFASLIGEKKQSEKTGEFLAFPKISSILGPVCGGFIASYFGFPILFLIVVILLFTSIVPLLFIKENVDHPKFDLEAFKHVKIKDFLILTAYGLKGFLFFIFVPLALYFHSQNQVTLGLIVSFLSLTAALFTIYTGYLSEKFGLKKIIRVGAVFHSILFFVFAFLTGKPLFLYISFLSGFVSVLIDVPYETYLFETAKKYRSPLKFLVFKEVSLFVGRAFLFGALILLGTSISLGFNIGGFSSLVFAFF